MLVGRSSLENIELATGGRFMLGRRGVVILLGMELVQGESLLGQEKS